LGNNLVIIVGVLVRDRIGIENIVAREGLTIPEHEVRWGLFSRPLMREKSQLPKPFRLVGNLRGGGKGVLQDLGGRVPEMGGSAM